MTTDRKVVSRLQFLARVVGKEARHLADTDRRLFEQPFSVERKEKGPDPFLLALFLPTLSIGRMRAIMF